MVNKRHRSKISLGPEEQLFRKRLQVNTRVQRYRDRRRNAKTTEIQIRQRERIVEGLESSEPIPTPLNIGLRLQELNIATDQDLPIYPLDAIVDENLPLGTVTEMLLDEDSERLLDIATEGVPAVSTANASSWLDLDDVPKGDGSSPLLPKIQSSPQSFHSATDTALEESESMYHTAKPMWKTRTVAASPEALLESPNTIPPPYTMTVLDSETSSDTSVPNPPSRRLLSSSIPPSGLFDDVHAGEGEKAMGLSGIKLERISAGVDTDKDAIDRLKAKIHRVSGSISWAEIGIRQGRNPDRTSLQASVEDRAPPPPALPNSPLGFGDDNYPQTQSRDSPSTSSTSLSHAFSATAVKILARLRSTKGCSEEVHREERRKHDLDVVEHEPLSRTYSIDVPKVLGYTAMLKDRGKATALNNSQFQECYSGSGRADLDAPNICLHAEESTPCRPEIAYDIDSYLFFAVSLAVAKHGIHWNPTPQTVQNIRTNVHIQREIRKERFHIKDTPHLYLGSVGSVKELGIYVLFPRLHQKGDRFVSLTDKQLSRWTDGILLKAIHRVMDANYVQHLPPSYAHACLQSTAKQTEARTHVTGSYQARQLQTHFLPPQQLGRIWNRVVEIVSTTSGFSDFADAQLFLSAKGIKLQFKPEQGIKSTIHDCLGRFKTFVNSILNEDYLDLADCYIDVGKETCASAHSLARQSLPTDIEPQVYLWRRCCLESYVKDMYGAKSRGKHVYYHVAMLQDTCNLSSTPSANSDLRRDGLVYSQFYGSWKEMFDALKTFPFANDGLEGLALDPEIRAAAATAAHATGSLQTTLENSYKHSKERVNKSIGDSAQKSFGVREEHRVSWDLFHELYEASAEPEVDEIVDVADTGLTAVWTVRTDSFLPYLWHTVNKYAAGFEMTAARSTRGQISWEETKIMAMFLRCLRFSLVAYDLRRESALWWDRQLYPTPSGKERVYVGLGFKDTLPRFGYAWMTPLIDWKAGMFKHPVRNKVLFGNSALMLHYQANRKNVQGMGDCFVALNECGHWYKRFKNARAHAEITRYMIHVCLRRYRQDVIHNLKKEIDLTQDVPPMQAMVGFSRSSVQTIFGLNELYLLNGNKSTIKTFPKMFEVLWGTGKDIVRTRFINSPYRKAYSTALGIYSENVKDVDPESGWVRRFQLELVRYHWIYPVPDLTDKAGTLHSRSKEGSHRMWWSLIGNSSDPEERKWGRRECRQDQLEQLPRMLEWEQEEMELHLVGISTSESARLGMIDQPEP